MNSFLDPLAPYIPLFGADHLLALGTVLAALALLLAFRRQVRNLAPVLEVGFYFGLYAYATFIYPQRIQPMGHLMGWSFLVSHAVTILMPVVVGIADGWRPTVRGMWRSDAWFLAYFGVVLAVNALTDGNYFYLKFRPFLQAMPDPLYWLAACAATLALMWIGYAVARSIPVQRGVQGAEITARSGLSARP